MRSTKQRPRLPIASRRRGLPALVVPALVPVPVLVLVLVLTGILVLPGVAAEAGQARAAASTTRVDLTSSGGQTSGVGFTQPDVSGDGRYAVFATRAALVPRDSNGLTDVYVRDRAAGTTRRVSAPVGDLRAVGGDSDNPAVSADGRYVAFVSLARNLVPGDRDRLRNVFVRDLLRSTTTQVDIGPGGVTGNRDARQDPPQLSADGRYVVFGSSASNLVAGDTNGAEDTFVRDLVTGTTRRVDLSSGGAQADTGSFYADISADGSVVAFSSFADNLVPGDTNGTTDLFVRDLSTGTTSLESVSTAGSRTSGDRSISYLPSVSGDGRYVAFVSESDDLVPGDDNNNDDVFLRDRVAGTTTLVSRALAGGPGNGFSFTASISADGHTVAFESNASDLVARDTNGASDIFVFERSSASVRRASVTTADSQAGSDSYVPSISADGRYVAFISTAANLVPADTNGEVDVFLRDRGAP